MRHHLPCFGLLFLMGFGRAAPVMNDGHTSLNQCLELNVEDVTFRTDGAFEQVRRSHNTRQGILPNPLAVVRVASEEEVGKAILCAAAYGERACARNGQHCWENSGSCTDGVVVDLQDLHDVTVDNDKMTVSFQGGATNGQVYWALAHNSPPYVTALGMNSPVGTGGLILGGGRGPLTSLYGLAIDNLVEVELVNHEGNVLVANSETNTDLFWVARGGGGGMFPGIVLRFTMKVYNAPTTITKFSLDFDRSLAPQVLERWTSTQGSFDRRMFSQILFWGKWQGSSPGISVSGLMVDAQPADVQEVLSPITSVLSGNLNMNVQSWLDIIASESGVGVGEITDRTKGYGGSAYPQWQAIKSTSMMGYKTFTISDGQELQAFLDEDSIANQSPAFGKYTSLYGVGGAATDVPGTATAYGHRGAQYILLFLAQYNAGDSAAEQLLLDHHDRMVTRMAQVLRADGRETVGAWFSYRDNDMPDARDDTHRQLEAYFGSNLPEILRIRWEHDPNGVFGIKELPFPQPGATKAPTPVPTPEPPTPPPTSPPPATIGFCSGAAYPTTCMDQGNCYTSISQCQMSGCSDCRDPGAPPPPPTPTPPNPTPSPSNPTPTPPNPTPTPPNPTPTPPNPTPNPPISPGTGQFCSGPTYPTTCMDQGNCYTSIAQCQSSGCSDCRDP